MDKELNRIKELIVILNKAAKAYYEDSNEIMSNFEYDALYDELVELEKSTGIVLADSPTVNVGYEVAKELVKERHESPMLSLDKTKDPQYLASFLGDQKGLLSWKLDGLTIVLTYENGTLLKAVTRGNGEIGEVVTNNAKTFKNIPLTISYKGKVTVRGEAVITYPDFEKINAEIEDADSKYKNPRNLCSGSVRQLDASITAKRSVRFYAFSLTGSEGMDFKNSHEQEFVWLKQLGFDVVPYKFVTADTMVETVQEYAREIVDFEIPSDGLVLLMDDIEYGRSLGLTAKFPRNAIAFKWKDEVAETVLREIEWSCSRTGLINPVAIFDSVQLEGTTVSRASLHNLSIIENMQLGIGDTITVYKANMIIPQIAENKTKSGVLIVPDICPVCGKNTVIKSDLGVKTLNCVNPDCAVKKIKAFDNYVSRNCLNIVGLSEETLEKFINWGFIHDFVDLYHLDEYKDSIIEKEGFGEKSYQKIVESVDVSRVTTCARLLSGLGISNIGTATAKDLVKHFDYDMTKLMDASLEDLLEVDQIGEVIAKGFVDYFSNEANRDLVIRLLKELTFEEEVSAGNQLEGLTFVITGSLNHYVNRDALKAEIEAKGGKVAGSVSKKTSFLINNDVTSTSGKNKKAKDLGVEIISEEDFMSRFGA